MRKEEIILSALTQDIEFTKKAIPHIQPEFFQDRKEKIVFSLIESFYTRYGKLPTKDVLTLELDELKSVPESEFDDTKDVLKSAFNDKYEYEPQWLLDETEKFCKERAVYNAIMQSVLIINGEDKKHGEGEIPKMLSDALAISFDHEIGHDYFADAEKRYEFYHRKESKLAFSIDILNKVTGGGVNRKTLNMFVAPPKAGKSLGLCSLAADYLRQGYNVVYITLELAEERIGERIDANLFNVEMRSVSTLDHDVFFSKIDQLKSKTRGKLRIKEYPTKTAGAGQFKNLLDDLKTKYDFVPDVMVVDYLGITASTRHKNSSNVNSYTYQQSVSEELRALAVEYDMAVWTAVQTNRSGMDASDFGMESIADSTGPIQTCDFAVAIIKTPELEEMNQIILKQLASRYGDSSYYNKFLVGLDKSRMRLYNLDDTAQTGIIQDVSMKADTPSEKPQLERYSKAKKTVAATDEWEF